MNYSCSENLDSSHAFINERFNMNNRKPLFITVDGIDGCGKSTQVRKVVEFLSSKGLKVVDSREPGGTKTGKSLRNILISTEYNVEPATELLLYSADRLEHQKKKVIPLLDDGTSVISDRFLPSTYAYQIFGRGLDKSLLDSLIPYSVIREPDITFIIDIVPEIALERALRRLKRSNKMDEEGKFEQLGVQFFQKVREGFLWYADNFNNVIVIDGSKNLDGVTLQILSHISKIAKV